MNTKLTLTVEKSVIERAKKYAAATGRSLSDIVESYLSSLTSGASDDDISHKLKRLVGAVKLPKDFDEKEAIRTYLENKHLK